MPFGTVLFFIFVSLILGDTTVLLLARDKYNITYLIILQGFLPPKTDPKAAPKLHFVPRLRSGFSSTLSGIEGLSKVEGFRLTFQNETKR